MIEEMAGRYKDDFEHFLQDIHGAQCLLPDDMWPDDFIQWLEDISEDDWFDYADKFAEKKCKALQDKIVYLESYIKGHKEDSICPYCGKETGSINEDRGDR